MFDVILQCQISKLMNSYFSAAYRSCQVWCYLRSGGLMSASGWVYPDGTRCHTGASANHYSRLMDGTKTEFLCLSGRCQVIFFVDFLSNNISISKDHTIYFNRSFRVTVVHPTSCTQACVVSKNQLNRM